MKQLRDKNKELELFLYRVRKRFFSRQAWVVLCKCLDKSDIRTTPEGIEVREAQEGDLASIAYALPKELAGRLSAEKRLAMVMSRYKAGTRCLIAVNKQTAEVLGGCWCRPLAVEHALRPLLPDWPGVFEISTLFVAPEARGNSVGSVLVSRACNVMAESGFQGCVSLVWYTRPASVKSHLKLRFRPVGEKVTASYLGYRKTWFSKDYRKQALPYYEDQAS